MLTFTYIALAVVGCGYVAFALVMGQLVDGDGSLDAADAGFHFPFFSPTTLATFCGALGALGLIALSGLGPSHPASVAVAVPAALLFTYVVTYAAWRLLVSSTGTQALRESDLVGATAEVLTPIPQDGLARSWRWSGACATRRRPARPMARRCREDGSSRWSASPGPTPPRPGDHPPRLARSRLPSRGPVRRAHRGRRVDAAAAYDRHG